MTVRVAVFADDHVALAAWTGEDEDRIRAGERYHGGEHVLAWDGDRVVGLAHRWRDPDGTQRLMLTKCRPDTIGPLARAVAGPCVATMESGPVSAMLAEGFEVVRHWDQYEIGVHRSEPAVPVEIRTAAEVEQDRLAALDAELRGTEADVDWFQRETYASPYFDPLTYRVATDGDRYVGLARIWLGPRPRPHLGAVGVLGPYRRRGIGRALLAAALRPLAERGVPVVTAAADSADTVSAAFLRAFHARVGGGWTELARPTGTASRRSSPSR